MPDVRLLEGSFDPGSQLDQFAARNPEAGGIVSFFGQVRSEANGHGGVEVLELRHFGPLTLPGMVSLGEVAESRWELDGLLILHRTGQMLPGDPIVLVAAAARHRRDAFAATDFVMDHLKSDSWFWKRERRDGIWHWIEPRAQDHADISRWG